LAGDHSNTRLLPTQDGATQTCTNIHALRGVQTRDPNFKATTIHALEGAVTVLSKLKIVI
jgi:hypothetical protein